MAFRKVEFIKDFAGKKKGDIYEADGQQTHQLVNNDKVAKYVSKDTNPKAVKKGK